MPADDLILAVQQITQWPAKTVVAPTDAVLLQSGGIGGPYYYAAADDLVSTALSGTTQALVVGQGPPTASLASQVFASWYSGGGLGMAGYIDSSLAWRASGVAPVVGIFNINYTTGNFQWERGASSGAGSLVTLTPAMTLDMAGDLNVLAGTVVVAHDPAAPLEVATMQWVTAQITALPAPVNTWNARTGDVIMNLGDVMAVGGAPIYSPNFQGAPTAPTPSSWSNSNSIATTAFTWGAAQAAINNLLATQPLVTTFNGRTGDVTLQSSDLATAGMAPIDSPNFTGSPTAPTPVNTDDSNAIATTAYVVDAVSNILSGGFAPINSPQFTGVPTAPTAAAASADGTLATTAFVQNAVTAGTAGVASWNTRTGAVTLLAADITGAGGALLASPALSGTPTGPTAAPGTSTTQLATTAFVSAAIGGGVTSFNTRTGAVTLTIGDVTGAGGAPLASPGLTGTPTAPTAATATSTTQLATTAFVHAVVTAAGGVTTFNGRSGAVTLQANDVSAVGGALTASPAFSGTPTAPTATVGTSTTQLATTAFVMAQMAASGVSSFNTRTGAVTLNSTDITGAGGAILASPTFTGTPAGPTASPGSSTTQLATTAFVSAAVSGAVTSFNGRTGAVSLTTADITGAGGAPLNSPSFTGAPLAPTAAPGTATQQIATTAFVSGAIQSAAVTSFNGRTGAVTFQANDISAVGGALLASPAFTGTPTAPTPVAGDNSTKVATTAFVAALPTGAYNLTFRNRLINGNMALDQRNEGAVVTANGTYTADRWKFYGNQAGHLEVGRTTNAVNGPVAVATHANTALNLTSLSAYTPLAGDNFSIWQVIEADTVGDLQFGGSSALPLVLSFWAVLTAGPTGLYSGSIRNAAATRSYVFTYNVAALSTPTFYQIAIPGDTAGTWITSGNGGSLSLAFDCGMGATYQTTAGSWQTGNFVGATGANKLVATNGAILQITNVQLEVGTQATPFELLPPDVALTRCQRYYEKSYAIGTAPGTATGNGMLQAAVSPMPSAVYQVALQASFKVTKRAGPTATFYSPITANKPGFATDLSGSIDIATTASGYVNELAGNVVTTVARALYNVGAQWTADADF